MEKIIFIDRDGVINVDLIGDYIKSWEEFRFEQGAVEGMKKLVQEGYSIVIISNQAGIGDGIFSEDALKEIHGNMIRELKEEGIPIRATFYCIHGKNAGCKCRKPETGLFEAAAKEIRFERSETFLIGDKASDVEAGKRFGLKTIFVRTGHGRFDEAKLTGKLKPDHRAENLNEAVDWLLR